MPLCMRAAIHLLGRICCFAPRDNHSSLDSLLFCPFNTGNNYANSAVDENQLRVCSFLSEMIEVRDRW
jgi:hypothetical protein